jgi:hypothetical protein
MRDAARRSRDAARMSVAMAAPPLRVRVAATVAERIFGGACGAPSLEA